MLKKKKKALHVYIYESDYLWLKEYCIENGQKGDFSHIIREAISTAVDRLKKISEDVCITSDILK